METGERMLRPALAPAPPMNANRAPSAIVRQGASARLLDLPFAAGVGKVANDHDATLGIFGFDGQGHDPGSEAIKTG